VISGVHLSELLICADWCRVESRKCDVRESLVRNEGRAMADLTINKPTDANPYNVFQWPNASSVSDASAQWSAVIVAQTAARNGTKPSPPTTNHNGTQRSQLATNNNGAQIFHAEEINNGRQRTQTVTTNNGVQSNQLAATKNRTQLREIATPDQAGDQKPAAGSSWSLWAHGALTAGSFLPSFVGAGFSAVDGALYSFEGDSTNATISFGAAALGLVADAGVVKAAALGVGAAGRALKVGEAAVKAEGASRGAKAGAAFVSATRGAETEVRGAAMQSSNLAMGVEKASPALIAKVAARRTVVIAKPGSDDVRFLDKMGAEASVGGPTYSQILLREKPSKAALLEEFLHGTQYKVGIMDKLGTSGFGSAETHVKDFMMRHQNLLGLKDADIENLKLPRDAGL
jgi:hypothetical protein